MVELLQKFIEQIGQDIETRFRCVLREFGLVSMHEIKKAGEKEWLSIEEAQKIVPIKSKQKWKRLRDEKLIDFAKVGKGYIYEITSLRNYLINHSTITQTKGNGKRRT